METNLCTKKLFCLISGMSVFLLCSFLPSPIFGQAQTTKKNSDYPLAYEKYKDIYPEKTKPTAFSFYHPMYLLLYSMPAKIQLSFKYNIFFDYEAPNDSGLYAAYSQISLLELFQSEKEYTSNPTVDNNYIPEVFYLMSPRDRIPWFSIQAGFMHQSNGQGGREAYKSVSWNQIYIEPQFHAHFWGGYLFSTVRFFVPSDLSENKRILDYTGFAEANFIYKTLVFGHTTGLEVDVMLRKGLKSYYGAFSLGVHIGPFFFKTKTIPLALFFQLWVGYGESLYLYNQGYTKFRVGLSLPLF